MLTIDEEGKDRKDAKLGQKEPYNMKNKGF